MGCQELPYLVLEVCAGTSLRTKKSLLSTKDSTHLCQLKEGPLPPPGPPPQRHASPFETVSHDVQWYTSAEATI